MEAAGLAFGVAGVTGIVTSCITIWEYISTARCAPDDLKFFLGQIYLETFSFFSWCQLTGLWDKVVEAQSDPGTAASAASQIQPRPRREDLALSSEGINDVFDKAVESNMKSVQQYLELAKTLLQEYGAIEPRKRNRLRKRNVLQEFTEASQALETATAKEHRVKAWDKTKWAVSGQHSSEEILGKLRASNQGLFRLLELVDHPRAQELWRLLQMGASVPILSRAVIESPALQASSRPLTTQESTIVGISQLSERERQIARPGAGWAVVQSNTAPYLKEGDFTIPEDDHDGPTPERQNASFRGKAVVIEWRYYSSRLSPDARELLRSRIGHLVLQLKQSSSTPGFLIPPCLGFFHSEPRCRYGIVFQTKTGGGRAPRTLYDCLMDDHCDKSQEGRDLGARLRLARQLVANMFRFFTVGWIHKNVRSSSFVFLGPEPADRLELADVYFLGFGRARSDTPSTQTELHPSALKEIQSSREWRLYCHPDRDPWRTENPENPDPSRPTMSQMHHDAFGLGIILLEIALWAPVTKICSSKQSVEMFHSHVLKDRLDTIRFNMGGGYAEVIRRLLKGDFGILPNQGESWEDDRILFLDAFEKTIVVPMETLFH
ncbi:hypothetical protein NEMBOFW57_010316 [Staphylotrichum longicolle]|uniref:Prion-inhibition and propagation HeLo domain-containing protein n=1 Tax=Staphylotrichum longicolle TaxID=669026 RepID=A0AAD4ERB6_9PEZI|nr:hypothetical protein NEMBOFW57_010316 [Staphylotrichum longicolle]